MKTKCLGFAARLTLEGQADMAGPARVCYDQSMSPGERLANWIAFGILVIALFAYLETKFGRLEERLFSLAQEVGELKGQLEAVRSQAHTHPQTPS